MITLKQPNEPKWYDLKCTKSIAEFVEGKRYGVQIMTMSGRIYKQGKEVINGKSEWIDKVGEPDERLMVIGSGAYCCRTKEVLDEHFETVN